MKSILKVQLSVGMLLFVAGCGGGGSSGGAPTPAPVPIDGTKPSTEPSTPSGRLEGTRAAADLQLANFTEKSFIELKSPLVFQIKRFSRYDYTGTKKAVAFFQTEGEQVYGPGTNEWMQKRSPYLAVEYKSCSIVMDLKKVLEAEATGSGVIEIPATTQLAFNAKTVNGSPETTKGTVSLKFSPNDLGLIELGCDHLTTSEITAGVFGNKLEFFALK